MRCQLCDHVFTHEHHILPKQWGGSDELENLAYFCPNHHAAIHLLMKWRQN